MQFTIAAVLAFAAATMAAPLVEERQVPLCTSGQAQCCATDVLNLADLDCANRTSLALPSLRLNPNYS
jgi:hypothetical protein